MFVKLDYKTHTNIRRHRPNPAGCSMNELKRRTLRRISMGALLPTHYVHHHKSSDMASYNDHYFIQYISIPNITLSFTRFCETHFYEI